MSSTYNGSSGSITPHQNVSITNPADGDALTAASRNVSANKLADISQLLMERAVLRTGNQTGSTEDFDPTMADDFNIVAIHKVSSSPDIFSRVYMPSRATPDLQGLLVTENARWNQGTAKWVADDATQGAYLFASATEGGLAHSLVPVAVTGTPWSTSAWFLPVSGGYLTGIPPGGAGASPRSILQARVTAGHSSLVLEDFLEQEAHTVVSLSGGGILGLPTSPHGATEQVECWKTSTKQVVVHGLIGPTSGNGIGNGQALMTLPYAPPRALTFYLPLIFGTAPGIVATLSTGGVLTSRTVGHVNSGGPGTFSDAYLLDFQFETV